MLLQLIEERLGQVGPLHKQAALGVVVLDEHAGVEDVLVDQAGAVALPDLKGQATTRDPLGLVAN